MAKVVWRPEALDQLDEIVAYIEQFNPPAADRMYRRLVTLGNSLRTSPARGRPASDHTRQLSVIRPYVLTYSVERDVVHILGVRHSARRPIA